jgi:hypothetical protein
MRAEEKMRSAVKISPGISFILKAAAFCLVFPPVVVSLLSCLGGSMEADCDIDRGPCVKVLGEAGTTAAFELLPRPVEPMKNIVCRIDLRRGQVPISDKVVRLCFSMPGMSMAEYGVVLRHTGMGRYEGNVTLVRCPSGMKIWRAETRIEGPSIPDPHPALVSFTFKVN